MNKKRLGFFLLAGLLLASALVFLPAVKDGVMAETTVTGIELRGWSWSSNTGWISFNSKDLASPPTTYAVTMSSTTKELSGYAWSSNLGWIKFDPSLSGHSGNDTPYGAKLVGTNLKGWARACSVFVSGCASTLKSDLERGGWDGWIKMINIELKENASGGKYFSGYAWGDLNLGWVNLGGNQDGPPGSCIKDIDTDCKNGPDCCSSKGPCLVDCGGTTKTLTCSVAGSNSNNNLDTTFTWKAVYTGSEPSLNYVWSGPSPLGGKTANPTSFKYTIAGTKTGNSVKVMSGTTPLKEVPCPDLTVEEVLPCTLNPGEPVGVDECCINGITPPVGELCPANSCTLTLGASPNDHIVFSNDADFPALSQVNARVSLSASCFTAGNVSFTGEGLPDKATLVCSGSRSGPYSVAGCGDLSLSDVWVGMSFEGHPSTFPSIGTVPPKVFTISAGSASVGTYLLYLNPVE
jgi:hypothetical protein